MPGYRICVHHGGPLEPTETLMVDRAGDVLDQIPGLLAAHPDCERIRVYSQDAFLFQVDCKGKPFDD